ncbi:MAG: hypothetical protein A4E67_00934 [Syntrophaceae bacterium PtaB.Bin038]|nr:MAG: hypothetical protein A4E67_00934 [Syntrophaceae bacterium PtaB.Bin038]
MGTTPEKRKGRAPKAEANTQARVTITKPSRWVRLIRSPVLGTKTYIPTPVPMVTRTERPRALQAASCRAAERTKAGSMAAPIIRTKIPRMWKIFRRFIRSIPASP